MKKAIVTTILGLIVSTPAFAYDCGNEAVTRLEERVFENARLLVDRYEVTNEEVQSAKYFVLWVRTQFDKRLYCHQNPQTVQERQQNYRNTYRFLSMHPRFSNKQVDDVLALTGFDLNKYFHDGKRQTITIDVTKKSAPYDLTFECSGLRYMTSLAYAAVQEKWNRLSISREQLVSNKYYKFAARVLFNRRMFCSKDNSSHEQRLENFKHTIFDVVGMDPQYPDLDAAPQLEAMAKEIIEKSGFDKDQFLKDGKPQPIIIEAGE